MSTAPMTQHNDNSLVRFAGPQIAYRDTRDGRRLMYECAVIQQPERARACGSGAKSASDRRPVDPPPVVQLKVFDVTYPEKRDITFFYNANFFLSASLEVDPQPPPHARNTQPSPANQVPVLTGAPIAGMAYLDRPEQAGYFIFPDLSVRHEGKYRLRFDLFEEIKNLRDREPIPYNATESERRDADASSFDWRLITMSAPFQVFSAKKFPGLAESTSLSRCVAEQGCRVRIRRDVRMRRRDNKARASVDNSEEQMGAQRIPTPQGSVHEVIPRPRSVSLGSIGRNSNTGDRRPSDQYDQRSYIQPYPSSSAAPVQSSSQYYIPPSHVPQSTSYPPPLHAGYQAQPPSPSQYRYAAPPRPPLEPIAQQQSTKAASTYYQADSYRPPPPPPPPPPTGLVYSQEPPRSQYDVEAKARDEYSRSTYAPAYDDYNSRRTSMVYGPSSTTSQYNNHGRHSSVAFPPPQQSYSNTNTIPPVRIPTTLAPLQMRMPPIEPKYDNQSPSMAGSLSTLSASTSVPTAYSNDRQVTSYDSSYSSATTAGHNYGPQSTASHVYNSSSNNAYGSSASSNSFNPTITANNYNPTPTSHIYGSTSSNNNYNPSTSSNNYHPSTMSTNTGAPKRSWESAFVPTQQNHTNYDNNNTQRQKLSHIIDTGSNVRKDEYKGVAPYVEEVIMAYKRADGNVMVRPLPKVQ